jgi:ABC-type transport system involved in multi-copper enzyme maturation permease subunit
MSGNDDFILLNESGWRRGLSNLLDYEFAGWFKTKMWWIQCIIWVSATCFILAGIMFSTPDFDIKEGMQIYSLVAGLFPAIGVIIIMQDALVGEKSEGTTAWVLSKPVSRPAVILSKAAANSVGVLVAMVAVPGLFAYGLFCYTAQTVLPPVPFLAAMGIIFIGHLFYLTLTLMMGAFFSGRGPVIGIGLGLVFLQQYIIALLPFSKYLLPWAFIMPPADQTQAQAVVPALLMGEPVTSYLPVVLVFLESILFVALAIWRFNKEEF